MLHVFVCDRLDVLWTRINSNGGQRGLHWSNVLAGAFSSQRSMHPTLTGKRPSRSPDDWRYPLEKVIVHRQCTRRTDLPSPPVLILNSHNVDDVTLTEGEIARLTRESPEGLDLHGMLKARSWGWSSYSSGKA